MRCKACNNLLEDSELIDNPETGELEDLCSTCRYAAYDSLIEETIDGLEELLAELEETKE